MKVVQRLVTTFTDIEASPNGLLSSQKELLPQLYRSHRLFVLNFFASILLAPLWILWVILFSAAIAESFEWFLRITTPVWITMPIIIIVLWFGWKSFFTYMQSAKRFLDNAKRDVNTSQAAEDFTTYINLLFPVLLPRETASPSTKEEEQQRIHRIFRTLRIMPIIGVMVFAILFFSFGSFFIRRPYVIPRLLLTPVIPFLWFNIGYVVVWFWMYFRWRKYIHRWLKLYEALITWQADLESTIGQSASDTGWRS